MPLSPYGRVLALPGVRSLTALGILARLPHTATAVILTVHVVQTLGRGYGAAGLVVAAWTLGMALGAPWRGRAVDRVGLRRALVPSILVEAGVWGLAPWLAFPTLLAAVVVGGAFALPVFTVIRLALSVLVSPAQRRTAFALDSITVEVSFMAGPTLGVLVATQVSTTAALLVLGLSTALAGLALLALDPATRSASLQPDGLSSAKDVTGGATRRVHVQLTPALLAVLGAAAGATVVLAGTDVSIIASLRSTDDLAWTGLVTAVWAFSSLLGGVVYGLLPRPVPPFLLLLGLGALTVPVALVGGPTLLALAMVPAGFLTAPVITATAEAITDLVPETVRGEAMGWHGSALTAGTAVGAPLAGLAIDRLGPGAGFATVGAAGILLAVAGLLAVATHQRTRRLLP